jgi:peroxiredoxin family protein
VILSKKISSGLSGTEKIKAHHMLRRSAYMRLGILVTTDEHPDAVFGITKAALSKGHEVSIFVMDAGTHLLHHPSMKELSDAQRIVMSFCEHSAQGLDVPFETIPAAIIRGSQYDNATMLHEADQVIVL